MKATKFIILALAVSIFSISTMGMIFAAPAGFFGTISDYSSANCNDGGTYVVNSGETFTITVSVDNGGIGDWENLQLYSRIPSGLQYISHVMPDISSQTYYPSTGIWDVQRMKWTGRGHHKYMIITVKALPEAEGKTLKFRATFKSLIFVEAFGNHTRTDIVAGGWAPPGNTIYIKVLPQKSPSTNQTNDDPTKNGTKGIGGPGSNGGLNNGDAGGTDLLTSLGNNNLASKLSNVTKTHANDPIQNLQNGGGANGKVYEVTKGTSETPKTTLMYLLAALLIIAVIIAGYFYGIKRER
jgi:uncharacterized repeat protein (TIGR01451 family)